MIFLPSRSVQVLFLLWALLCEYTSVSLAKPKKRKNTALSSDTPSGPEVKKNSDSQNSVESQKLHTTATPTNLTKSQPFKEELPDNGGLFGQSFTLIAIGGGIVATLLLLTPILVYLMGGFKGKRSKSGSRRLRSSGGKSSHNTSDGGRSSGASLDSKEQQQQQQKKSSSGKPNGGNKKKEKRKRKRMKNKDSGEGEGGSGGSSEEVASGEAAVGNKSGMDTGVDSPGTDLIRINPPISSIQAPLSTTGFLSKKYHTGERPQMAPLLKQPNPDSPTDGTTSLRPSS